MKILGIDDNQDLLDLCNVALSSAGHEYTAIANSKEGLQAIKDKKFDLLMLLIHKGKTIPVSANHFCRWIPFFG